MTLLAISRVNSSFDVNVDDYITRDKLVISFHRLLISEIVYWKRQIILISLVCLREKRVIEGGGGEGDMEQKDKGTSILLAPRNISPEWINVERTISFGPSAVEASKRISRNRFRVIHLWILALVGEYTCGSTISRLLEMPAATRDRSSFEKYLRFAGRSCGAIEKYIASFLEQATPRVQSEIYRRI